MDSGEAAPLDAPKVLLRCTAARLEPDLEGVVLDGQVTSLAWADGPRARLMRSVSSVGTAVPKRRKTKSHKTQHTTC